MDMKRFIFIEDEKYWLVEAPNMHEAVSKAVKEGFANGDMESFYYGLEDGQIEAKEITKVLSTIVQATKPMGNVGFQG